MPPVPPVPQEPAPALSSPPPADVSTFLAFPSPEKLLRLGPKSSALIAQQVTACKPALAMTSGAAGPEGRAEPRGLGQGGSRREGCCLVFFFNT